MFPLNGAVSFASSFLSSFLPQDTNLVEQPCQEPSANSRPKAGPRNDAKSYLNSAQDRAYHRLKLAMGFDKKNNYGASFDQSTKQPSIQSIRPATQSFLTLRSSAISTTQTSLPNEGPQIIEQGLTGIKAIAPEVARSIKIALARSSTTLNNADDVLTIRSPRNNRIFQSVIGRHSDSLPKNEDGSINMENARAALIAIQKDLTQNIKSLKLTDQEIVAELIKRDDARFARFGSAYESMPPAIMNAYPDTMPVWFDQLLTHTSIGLVDSANSAIGFSRDVNSSSDSSGRILVPNSFTATAVVENIRNLYKAILSIRERVNVEKLQSLFNTPAQSKSFVSSAPQIIEELAQSFNS